MSAVFADFFDGRSGREQRAGVDPVLEQTIRTVAQTVFPLHGLDPRAAAASPDSRLVPDECE